MKFVGTLYLTLCTRYVKVVADAVRSRDLCVKRRLRDGRRSKTNKKKKKWPTRRYSGHCIGLLSRNLGPLAVSIVFSKIVFPFLCPSVIAWTITTITINIIADGDPRVALCLFTRLADEMRSVRYNVYTVVDGGWFPPRQIADRTRTKYAAVDDQNHNESYYRKVITVDLINVHKLWAQHVLLVLGKKKKNLWILGACPPMPNPL